MNKIRIRLTLIYILTIFIFSPWSFTAFAAEFHEEPYDFLFDNHIDTHQETRLKLKNGEPVSLNGFFYIIYTGEIDPVSGLPIARPTAMIIITIPAILPGDFFFGGLIFSAASISTATFDAIHLSTGCPACDIFLPSISSLSFFIAGDIDANP